MRKELISKVIFYLLSISLLLGYERVYISGLIINIYAWINLTILLLLVIYYLYSRMKSFYILSLLFVFIFYIFVGSFFSNTLTTSLRHSYTYLPFIIAIFILELKIGYEIKTVLFYFTITASIGALSAIIIQIMYPDILRQIMKVEDITEWLKWGRVMWLSSAITLPLLTQLDFLRFYTFKEKLMLIPCIIIIVTATLLGFGRTMLIAVFILLSYILIKMILNRKKIKHIVLLVSFALIVIPLLNYYSMANANFSNLLEYRVFSFFSGKADISSDISSRNELYTQYIDNIFKSNFVGQGFGVPLSSKPEPRNWADVTLVNFLLPMGFLGLTYFLIFVFKVYNSIRSNIKIKSIKKVFYIVSTLALAISFNWDIWTHTNFPVFFIFIINSFAYNINNKYEDSNTINSKLIQPYSNLIKG